MDGTVNGRKRAGARGVYLLFTWCVALVLAAGASAAFIANGAGASPDNYIQTHNRGAYLAQVCYDWIDSAAADYCHSNRPAGDTVRANFPADATQARVYFEINTGINASRELGNQLIVDTNRNYCFEMRGSLFAASYAGVDC